MKRVTGKELSGVAQNGVMHLINSGATALDATGCSKDANGAGCMKPWWDMEQSDISACLKATDWCRADYQYFRGGGFSSHFKTEAEMPVTMARLCLIDGLGPVMQIAEGYTAVLPDEIHQYFGQTDRLLLADNLVCAPPDGTRRVYRRLQRDGKLGCQSWCMDLWARGRRSDYPVFHAAYSRLYAQCR